MPKSGNLNKETTFQITLVFKDADTTLTEQRLHIGQKSNK